MIIEQPGVFMPRLYALLIGCVLVAGSAFANEIFVDNSMGRDANDGEMPDLSDARTGPVRTLSRAVQLAKMGDTIVLTNNGIPYYDSLSLTGERHSGTPYQPFVIDGNGATLSGLRSLPPEGWRKVAPKLWKVTFTRKGFYQLLRNGRPLPEFRPENGLDPLQKLESGHWVAWRGSVYFHQDTVNPPTEQFFAYTADQTGISLHSVRNVLIKNLTLQHFRFDGVHAQGICDKIELENVSCVENGRAGVVSSGGSTVELFGGSVARNGRHQILAIGRSTATQRDLDPKIQKTDP
jgi:hypothetical protein